MHGPITANLEALLVEDMLHNMSLQFCIIFIFYVELFTHEFKQCEEIDGDQTSRKSKCNSIACQRVVIC